MPDFVGDDGIHLLGAQDHLVRRGRERRAPRASSQPREDPPTRETPYLGARVRWFPALVSNHVVDLVNKYPREELPESLTDYIVDREEYDYRHHAEVGSSNADYIEGDVIDSFSILGTPEAHVERLVQLAEVGVDPFDCRGNIDIDIGIGVSTWPWLVPYRVTFRHAAAAAESQSLLLIGAVIMLPVVLAYTGYCYWIFRGKSSHETSY